MLHITVAKKTRNCVSNGDVLLKLVFQTRNYLMMYQRYTLFIIIQVYRIIQSLNEEKGINYMQIIPVFKSWK